MGLKHTPLAVHSKRLEVLKKGWGHISGFVNSIVVGMSVMPEVNTNKISSAPISKNEAKP